MSQVLAEHSFTVFPYKKETLELWNQSSRQFLQKYEDVHNYYDFSTSVFRVNIRFYKRFYIRLWKRFYLRFYINGNVST